MNLKQFDIDPIDVDPNGIAESQTLGGAGDLTLDGVLIVNGFFDIYKAGYSTGIGGVRIGIDSAGNVSGVVFTVTGTDQDGKAASEDITGVTTTLVESTTYWRTITQIAANGAVGSGTFVGPVDEVITKTVPINYRQQDSGFATAVLGLSGTIQFDLQQTFEETARSVPINWIDYQSDKTANLATNCTPYATAVRLVVDSYTSGAELQFHVNGD